MRATRPNSDGKTRQKPTWMKALLISLPIWVYLLIESITVITYTTPWIHAPGHILWVLLHPDWEGAHNPSYVLMFVANCLFYYLLILAGVVVWRRIRHRGK